MLFLRRSHLPLLLLTRHCWNPHSSPHPPSLGTHIGPDRHFALPYFRDADNDASDVGSLLSVHATTSIVHPVASPKMAQQANLHAQPSATVPVPVAVRKALGAKKGDELSGEGSMSEGPDST